MGIIRKKKKLNAEKGQKGSFSHLKPFWPLGGDMKLLECRFGLSSGTQGGKTPSKNFKRKMPGTPSDT